MKIGIITDVHSNIIALNEVLNKFERIKVDKIICCGDIIGIGPKPEETVQELMKNKDKLIAIRGNHEQYLLKGLPKNVHDDKRAMSLEEIDNHEWTHSKLSENSKNFISQFKISNIIEIEGKKIHIVHYPNNEDGIYKQHIKNTTIKQNQEMCSGINADIFIYGHTHTISINNKNNKWYINPGSLGCPAKSNIANAGILEINKNEVYYKQLKIEYNVNEVIQEIERLKFPFYKGILKIFYGKE